jgi:hypothetical protein
MFVDIKPEFFDNNFKNIGFMQEVRVADYIAIRNYNLFTAL